MSVLRWDKPKKIRTAKENADHYGFEDGPTGGYQPNMSEADSRSWKAKLVGHTKGFPQVEIRRQCGPSLLLVIVNLGKGYNYKHYQSDSTKGINVHMSTNGPIQMNFEEFSELSAAVAESELFLTERFGAK